MALRLAKKKGQAQRVVKRIIPQKKKTVGGVTEKTVIPAPTGVYVEGIGRRKVATARVRLFSKAGDFTVNGILAKDYFASIAHAVKLFSLPLTVTGTDAAIAVSARVSGSGIRAQLDAVVHGLSRAIDKQNSEFHTLLKQAGLLTRDDRMKETRKIGMGGKARRSRQSPRR
ncbi:MAG: 30S ribosomal protein S9 [Candidatus Pacebacteria bacterium]|nr:30S ribosomal protein S9 [Candidatus Paceibacterota bacterium]PIR59579.1 MAG: 30S ribosomal protein S9 [Candidatus Pacebacteria bacterium CG10_big_fil_rev_8_21_14_0_10_45_6]